MESAFPASAPPPVLVTVFFGANDAALPDRSSARQHVPVAEYAANLASMVAFLRDSRGAGNVLLITPPPVDEAARLAFIQERDGKSPATELPVSPTICGPTQPPPTPPSLDHIPHSLTHGIAEASYTVL